MARLVTQRVLADRLQQLVAVLTDAGIRVLERSTAIVEVDGARVGIVGLKGFVGGFPDSALPDFGEPILRQVYAVTSGDVDALDRGLRDRPGALRLVGVGVSGLSPYRQLSLDEP